MSEQTFLIVDGERRGPLAYRGKEGCTDVRCLRMFTGEAFDMERCVGWHCSYCDKPCSYQGHGCEVATPILNPTGTEPE